METNETIAIQDQNSTSSLMHFYRKEQVTFLTILLVAILLGNSAVLVAIGRSKQGHKSRMNFFIMHLAIADLLVGLISVLTDLIWKITLAWHAGDVMCKSVRYGQAVVIYASTYILVALSIDRLDAIVRPLNFMRSNFRARMLVCLAWTLSSVFSLPMLFINKVTSERGGLMQCRIRIPLMWHWQVYITLISIVLFIIPAFIIAGCYATIVYTIWQKTKILGSTLWMARVRYSISTTQNTHSRLSCDRLNYCGGNPGAMHKESSASSRGIIPQAKIKTVKMTLVIVIAFILCWSPFFVFDLMDVYGLVHMEQAKYNAVTIFIQSLAPLNSVANPVIFYVFSSPMQLSFRFTGGGCDRWSRRLVCCNSDVSADDEDDARVERRTHDRRQVPTASTVPLSTTIIMTCQEEADDHERRFALLSSGGGRQVAARRKFGRRPPSSSAQTARNQPDDNEEEMEQEMLVNRGVCVELR